MSIKSVPRQHGLSLIELVIFIVIVSVAVTGVLSVMNVTVKSSADPMLRKQALAFGEAILEEVLAKDFANPAGGFTETSATCANRSQYDDVGDYACFAGPPYLNGASTLGATAISTLASYNASIVVSPVTVSGLALKKVTVTVTGGVETIVLNGYRANY